MNDDLLILFVLLNTVIVQLLTYKYNREDK